MDRTNRRRLAFGTVAILAGLVTATTLAADDAPGRRPLRVGVVTIAAIVEWQQDRPVGPMAEVWDELARRIGHETEFVNIDTITAFTSVLTATMTAERVTGTIQGPRDLAGRLVAVQAMTVAKASVLRRGGVPQDYPTLREAVEARDAGAVRAVVGETVTRSYLVNQVGRGRLRVVGPLFDTFDYGLALPSGSPLREPINAALLRMREEGTIDRIAELAFGKHD